MLLVGTDLVVRIIKIRGISVITIIGSGIGGSFILIRNVVSIWATVRTVVIMIIAHSCKNVKKEANKIRF